MAEHKRSLVRFAASGTLGSSPPLDRLQHSLIQLINEWQLSLDRTRVGANVAKVWFPIEASKYIMALQPAQGRHWPLDRDAAVRPVEGDIRCAFKNQLSANSQFAGKTDFLRRCVFLRQCIAQRFIRRQLTN